MIDEGMWNRLLEQREELLAEVKQLRERVKTEKNLNLWEKAEVKRLRGTVKMIMEYMRTEGDSDDYYTLKEMIE